MDPDPALTHLYSCSRWADADPAEVGADGPLWKDSRSMVDIWGEVKDHLVIFIHGGFWQVCSVHRERLVMCTCLNNLGAAMAAVGYELASSTWPLSAVVRQVGKAVQVGFYFMFALARTICNSSMEKLLGYSKCHKIRR
uniref:Abhydrolase_3 domain-containing protein n=1 Tax=Angiostrongylus cantonensis TaxID=6313 RepID=A0A0K0CV80_ANGCA